MTVKIVDKTSPYYIMPYYTGLVEALTFLLSMHKPAKQYVKENNKECAIYAIKLYNKDTDMLEEIHLYNTALTENQLAERTTEYYKDNINNYSNIQFCVAHNHM